MSFQYAARDLHHLLRSNLPFVHEMAQHERHDNGFPRNSKRDNRNQQDQHGLGLDTPVMQRPEHYRTSHEEIKPMRRSEFMSKRSPAKSIRFSHILFLPYTIVI